MAPPTDRSAKCLERSKHIWSCNRCRKQCPNLCIIGDAILPQTGTKLPQNAVLNLALSCGAIWHHREKQQYRCTTTFHPVYNCSKKDFGKLPFWTFGAHKLVHSEPFLDYLYGIWQLLSALRSDMRKFFLYRCTSIVSALNYCSRIFQNLQLSIRSGAHKLFSRFLDFSQFVTTISQKLWRQLATNMRTKHCGWKSNPLWKNAENCVEIGQ